MQSRETDLDDLIGKTLEEARALCPDELFAVRESNGKFAGETLRIVRARRTQAGIEAVLSGFKERL